MKFSTSFKNTLINIICYAFILLFVYASVSKLLEFQDFQSQLGQSPLLGAFAVPISYAVIIVELVIAVFLVFERTRRLGLIISFVLMVMFTVYIIIILNFTSFTPCSCGGVLEDLGWTEHLVFNMVFIALAIAGLFLTHNIHFKKQLFHYLGLSLLGSAIVIALFLFSDKEIKRNNAFQRKYMPHGLEDLGSLRLETNAYYIAGIDDSLIYLGNYKAPLYLKLVHHDLKRIREVKIEIENYQLPYRRVKIEVKSPYLFIADGTVPIIFRGKINDWKAKHFSHNDFYFNQFISVDSMNLAFSGTDSETQSNLLGLASRSSGSVNVQLNNKLIKKQIDGRFDTDGMLLWNNEHSKILYVYYYRNQYVIADSRLNNNSLGKTIDTISKAQLNIANYKNNTESKLGSAVKVNRLASSSGNNLFISSDRLGRYEEEEVLKSASIIDQYDFLDNSYVQSFYFYHQPGEKLSELKVYNDLVIGIAGDELRVKRIKKKYYK